MKLVTIECGEDGALNHMASGAFGYVTLCGMDGDCPLVAEQKTIDTPRGARVNCHQCVTVWLYARQCPKWQIDESLLRELEENL